MKAIVLSELGGPDQLQLETVDTPEPKSGAVRVRLRAAALNRRDLFLTQGAYPKIQLPCVPGSDGAGVVDALGSGADPELLGKEVVIYPAREWGGQEDHYGPDFRVLGMPDQGTFAEYICVPASDVYPKPAHLDWHHAAALPLAGLTAWRAVVTQAEVKAGQRVLVTGAGSGVSLAAILWCVHLDAEVYVTSSTEEKIARAQYLGARGGVIYKDPDWAKSLFDLSGGFDAVIDSAGGDGVNECLRTLKGGGRYVFFGATLGNPSTGLKMPSLFFRHIRMQGTTMGSPSEFGAMLDFVKEHEIKPVVDQVFPLSDTGRACKRLEHFGQTGKIVLDI